MLRATATTKNSRTSSVKRVYVRFSRFRPAKTSDTRFTPWKVARCTVKVPVAVL